MGASQPRLFTTVALGSLISIMALLPACKGPTTPEPPPATQYDHDITIATPLFLQDGTPAAGSFTVTMNGQVYIGTFGQKLVLPRTTKQEEVCEVVLNTNGLKRTYKKGIIIQGTTLAPSVVKLPYPIQTYIAKISTIGSNPIWGMREVNVTWNPNQGLILNQTQKNAVMSIIYDPGNPLNPNTFKNWSWVPNWPSNDQYFLKNITYADGNYVISQAPSNGEIRVFPEFGGSTSHTCYPITEDRVMAFKLYLGEYTPSNQAIIETEASFPDRQGIAGYADLPDWFRLMFNRPNTSDYSISSDGEVQDGFDARSTSIPTSNLRALGSAVDPRLLNPAFTPENTYSPAPANPLLHRPGQRATAPGPASRPTTKDRIRN